MTIHVTLEAILALLLFIAVALIGVVYIHHETEGWKSRCLMGALFLVTFSALALINH